MPKHLHNGDEDLRRFKIMDASRAGDASLLPQLLAQLAAGETYENRRHIVRAMGNIGGPPVEARLLELLASERGLILGEVAQAIGKLGIRRAASALEGLCDHESEWVRQNARFALKQLADNA